MRLPRRNGSGGRASARGRSAASGRGLTASTTLVRVATEPGAAGRALSDHSEVITSCEPVVGWRGEAITFIWIED